MRVTLALITLSLAIAPAAHSQTTVSGQAPAAQTEPQDLQDRQAQDIQTQQNGLTGAPAQSGLAGQVQTDQNQLQRLETQDVPGQIQQEQHQRDEIDQSNPQAPTPATH
jgi:hypothetical protein